MLLATLAYPGPALFLQYSGWKRGRNTFRDKAAFQRTPCSSNVLTVPASKQKGNCVQQVPLISLSKRKAWTWHESCLPVKKKKIKNQPSSVRCIKKNNHKVGQLERVGLFLSGSCHRI